MSNCPPTFSPSSTLCCVYPYDLTPFVGSYLLKQSNLAQIPTTNVVAEVIGFYFSAHWCPPCRMFTPQLSSVYSNLRAAEKSLEIIFVSLDKNEADFQAYFQSMAGWLALPYHSIHTHQLRSFFGAEGIPHLVFINGKTGSIIAANGREQVMQPGLFLDLIPPDVDFSVRDWRSVDDAMEVLSAWTAESVDEKRSGLKALYTALNHLIERPHDIKYRTLKKNARVLATLGSKQLQSVLKFCGFRETDSAFICYRFNPQRVKAVREVVDCLGSSLDEGGMND